MYKRSFINLTIFLSPQNEEFNYESKQGKHLKISSHYGWKLFLIISLFFFRIIPYFVGKITSN